VNTRQREGGLHAAADGGGNTYIPAGSFRPGRVGPSSERSVRRQVVSAATRGREVSRRVVGEGKSTGRIGQPRGDVLPGNDSQLNDECQPSWRSYVRRLSLATPCRPSGLASYDTEPSILFQRMHSHACRSAPGRSSAGPRTDGSGHACTPRAHPAQTPAPPTGTTTPRPRYAPPRGSDLMSRLRSRSAAAGSRLGKVWPCRTVKVGQAPALPCRTVKVEVPIASGRARLRAGRGTHEVRRIGVSCVGRMGFCAE